MVGKSQQQKQMPDGSKHKRSLSIRSEYDFEKERHFSKIHNVFGKVHCPQYERYRYYEDNLNIFLGPRNKYESIGKSELFSHIYLNNFISYVLFAGFGAGCLRFCIMFFIMVENISNVNVIHIH